MSIESKIQPDRLNIKDLSMEAEQDMELYFNPKKEIKREDWERIERIFESEKPVKDIDVPFFARLAAGICLVDPLRAGRLITEKDRQNCAEYIRNNHFDINTPNSIELAMRLKLMGIDIKKELPDNAWSSIYRELDLHSNGNIFMFAERVLYTKIIDPEKAEEYEKMIQWDKILEILQANLKRDRSDTVFTGRSETVVKILKPETLWQVYDWQSYDKILAHFRHLMSNKVGFIGSGTPDESWEIGDLVEAMEVAANLRILSAQETKITEQGLRIIDHPSPTQRANAVLPEVKKF